MAPFIFISMVLRKEVTDRGCACESYFRRCIHFRNAEYIKNQHRSVENMKSNLNDGKRTRTHVPVSGKVDGWQLVVAPGSSLYKYKLCCTLSGHRITRLGGFTQHLLRLCRNIYRRVGEAIIVVIVMVRKSVERLQFPDRRSSRYQDFQCEG